MPDPTPVVDPTPADAPPPDPAPEPIDWEDRYNAQKKVNQDLNDKLQRDRAEFEKDARARIDDEVLRKALDVATEKVQGQLSEATKAVQAANARILRSEVRAAAAGKLSDPADALQFLDLSKFEVNADGEVDAAALSAAVDDLIARKPYLARDTGAPFVPGAPLDQGPRDKDAPSLADQAAQALKEGRVADSIRLKQEAFAASKKP